MEEYRRVNAFSTVALSRSDGTMQTEIRKLYDALRNGNLNRVVFDSYKAVLEAVRQRYVVHCSV
jgi:hypothetical protein